MKSVVFLSYFGVFLVVFTQCSFLMASDELSENQLVEESIEDSLLSPVENKRDGFKEVEKNCIEPSYSERQCIFEKNKKILMDLDKNENTNASHQYKEDIAGEIQNEYPLYPLNNEYLKNALEKRNAVEKKVKDLIFLAQLKASLEGLSECQRACLATCMSSKIIQYAFVLEKQAVPQFPDLIVNPFFLYFNHTDSSVEYYSFVPDASRKLGALGAILEGKGVCRQFSYIATDFMKALGLKAKPVTNTRQPGWHEVVRVKVAEKKYLMEPQSADCTFYPLPDETN